MYPIPTSFSLLAIFSLLAVIWQMILWIKKAKEKEPAVPIKSENLNI